MRPSSYFCADSLKSHVDSLKAWNAFLIDLDGTLADTAPLVENCWIRTCFKFGIRLPDDFVKNFIGIPLSTQIELLLGESRRHLRGDFYTEYVKIQKNVGLAPFFPNWSKVLRALVRKGKSLCVVSSRRTWSCKEILKSAGLMDVWDHIIGPEDVVNGKPDPDAAIVAMKKLNMKAEECVFIGDAVYDILCGNQANMDTLLVGWSPLATKEPASEKEKPNFILNDPMDLLVD